MNDQYYTSVPSSASNEREFALEFMGETCRFITDNGVFSKGELDEGTRIMLEALPEIRGRVLDLGCGWGPVGVILGKKYPDAEIVMADVNTRALELSEKNLRLNGVKNARTVQSDVYSGVEGAFDFIITNPPIRAGKQVIYSMFDGAKPRLTPGGSLIIVIRKQQGAPSAHRHLEEVYGEAEIIAKEKSYWVIRTGNMEK